MNHTPDLLNHPALRPYKDSICATARRCAEITLLPAEHLTVWQSKLGGQPYWPKDMEYPRNAKGRPLHLLAQINFAETPPLPDFPEKGILQFFISRNDGIEKMWGMNAENPADQQGFRVVYHADIEHEQDRLLQDFRFLAQARQTPKSNHILQRLAAFWHSQRPGLPFEHACAMRFERQQKYASLEEANGVFLRLDCCQWTRKISLVNFWKHFTVWTGQAIAWADMPIFCKKMAPGRSVSGSCFAAPDRL